MDTMVFRELRFDSVKLTDKLIKTIDEFLEYNKDVLGINVSITTKELIHSKKESENA